MYLFFFSFCRAPPSAAHTSTGSRQGEHGPPPPRAAAQTPAPPRGTCARVGLAETTAPAPVFPLPRRPLTSPVRQRPRRGARGQPLAPGRGSARGLAGPGLGSPTGEAPVADEPSGSGNGTGQLPAAGRPRPIPKSRSWGFQQTPEFASFPLWSTLIHRKIDR